MRKLLDRIADKLGYQRKFTSIPIQWPPLSQELIDDGIAMSSISWDRIGYDAIIEILEPFGDTPPPTIKAILEKID